MYNSAAQAFDTTYKTNIVVYSSGSCNYIPPGIFQSTCKVKSKVLEVQNYVFEEIDHYSFRFYIYMVGR